MLTIALSHIAALTLTFTALAWYRPQALRSLGNGLIRLCDAMEAARDLFHDRKPAAAPKVRKAAAADPLLEDITSALVNLGTSKATARAAACKAIHGPGPRDFESTFKVALQMAR